MATEEDTQHPEHNHKTKDIDHIDKQSEANQMYDQLFSIGVTFTSNKLGQYAVRKIDRLLWVIENTAKWSVPQNINESESSVPPPPLIRPLNWFVFIPALIVMRLFRAGASFALLMWGYDALAPIAIVRLLQKQRRILRAIRYQGLKTIRARNIENKQSTKKGLLSGFMSFVSGLICTRGNLEEPIQIVVKPISPGDGHSSKKRLLSDEEDYNEDDENDLNLTCADLLDKYGSILSCSSDSDFEPDVVDDEDTSSDSGEESEHDLGEESEPEGRTGEVEIDEESEEEEKTTKEAEKIDEPNKTNTSEPVEIIQNNNNYCNEYKRESYPATLYGSNPEDKFYSPIESPVPPEEQSHSTKNDSGESHQKSPVRREEHSHSVTYQSGDLEQKSPVSHEEHSRSAANDSGELHKKSPVRREEHNHSVTSDSGDLQQSKPSAKFYHNQPHNFNYNQPPRSVPNSFNFHYQYNLHQPSHQQHNPSNSPRFLAHENGGSHAQIHEPLIHNKPPPSSLSPTSSTSSSTTNVSTANPSSTPTAGDSMPNKKKQTKYNKHQKNRSYGYGGGNKQNSKKTSY